MLLGVTYKQSFTPNNRVSSTVHTWIVVQEMQKRIHNLEEELRISFDTLKSELDNLGKILNQILKGFQAPLITIS